MIVVRLIKGNEGHGDYVIVYDTNIVREIEGEPHELISDDERIVCIEGRHFQNKQLNGSDSDHFIPTEDPRLFVVSKCHQRRTSNGDWEIVSWVESRWVSEQRRVTKQHADIRNRKS